MRAERAWPAGVPVRHTGAIVAVALALVLVGSWTLPAMAQPTSPPPEPENGRAIEVPDPVPGEEVCTITDQRLQELSGMAVLDDGTYVVINDGGQTFESQPIFFLNQECQVIDEVRYPPPGERDPEDVVLDREAGILWVGDIGDNQAGGTAQGEPRQTVALWRVDLNGDRTPVIHRFVYPEGPHDAETLILDGDGTPIIVTRAIGTVHLYRPAAPLVPNNDHEQAVPLERVGEFQVPDTGAEFPPLPVVGPQVVTGGDTSPDRTRVVLRTFTDAFEFDVVDGDVAGAITGTTPRVTPLPNEPWGEAITYTPDGEHFLTVSEVAQEQGQVDPVILRYTPTAPAPEAPPEEPAAGEGAPAASRSLLDRLGWQGILNLIAAVGVVGLLMVGAGVYGILKARRRAADDPEPDDEDEPDWDVDERTGRELAPPGAAVTARARVASPPPPPPPAVPPEVPGRAAGAPAAPARGTVYGASAGYQEHPFDQDLPTGYPDHPPDHPEAGYAAEGHYSDSQQGQAAGTYRGGTYQAGTYQGGGYAAEEYPPDAYGDGRYHPEAHPAEAYRPEAHQPRQDEVPDYYYDDPDYSYEFRDRGY